MKDITGTITNTGNVSTDGAVQVKFDASGMGHLMQVLSNMYSNKEEAVLREYSCNARDSHVEAGQTKPIEISLPSDLQPTLLVQDYGVGLNRDSIINVFGAYGASTKRDTNDQVGAFGIGSKSAFTMGHQFVVTGVKDGVKTVALFSMGEDNIGVCNILQEVETEEPNGVLISLAVEDVNAMRRTAERFFATWPKGTVLVDGEEPESIFDRATKVNDTTSVIKDHDGAISVVMGAVVYPVSRDIRVKVAARLKDTDAEATAQRLVDWGSDTSVYFDVPIGSVHLAPSREAVRDTPQTLTALAKAVEDLASDLTKSVQDQVDKATSPYQGALFLRDALDGLGDFKVKRSAISFAGNAYTKEVEIEIQTFHMVKKSWRGAAMIVGKEAKFTADIKRAERTLVVTGVPEGEEGTVSRYLKRFLQESEQGQAFDWVLTTPDATGSHDWFEWGVETGVTTWTREEYKASLRKDRDTNPRTKNEPSYSTGFGTASRDLEDRDLLTDIISWGKDLVIYHDSAYSSPLRRKALEPYTVVVLLGTQSEKALRDRVAKDGTVGIFDGNVEALVKAEAHKVLVTLTDDEKQALSASQWLDRTDYNEWLRFGSELGLENITSATRTDVIDTVEIARLVAGDLDQARKQQIEEAMRPLNSEERLALFPTYDAVIPTVEETYPLASRALRNAYWDLRNNDADGVLKAEFLEYINAR